MLTYYSHKITMVKWILLLIVLIQFPQHKHTKNYKIYVVHVLLMFKLQTKRQECMRLNQSTTDISIMRSGNLETCFIIYGEVSDKICELDPLELLIICSQNVLKWYLFFFIEHFCEV